VKLALTVPLLPSVTDTLLIDSVGGQVLGSSWLGSAVKARLPVESIQRLRALDSVEVIETATPRTFYETTRRKFGMIGASFNSAGEPASLESFAVSHLPNLFLIGDTVSSGFGGEGIARKSRALADRLTR